MGIYAGQMKMSHVVKYVCYKETESYTYVLQRDSHIPMYYKETVIYLCTTDAQWKQSDTDFNTVLLFALRQSI